MVSDETFDHDHNDLSSYTMHWEHNVIDNVDLTPLEFCEIVGDECVEYIACDIVKVKKKYCWITLTLLVAMQM